MKPGEKFGVEISPRDLREAIENEDYRNHQTFAGFSFAAHQKGIEVVPLDDEVLSDLHYVINRIVEDNQDGLSEMLQQAVKIGNLMAILRSGLFYHNMKTQGAFKNAMGQGHAFDIRVRASKEIRLKRNFLPRLRNMSERQYLNHSVSNLTCRSR